MINKNISLKYKPFLLQPVGQDYLWGGNRLRTEYNKEIALQPIAETWECSTHPDGSSIVASGIFKGKMLRQVITEHPEYLGRHSDVNGDLPILIKFIDAKQNLSVQVHPDDAYAYQYENGQSGKTEMWYVVDASIDAKLVYGFHHDISKEQLLKNLTDGTVEKYLQKVKIQKNDIFFIEAGMVHGIGAGVLIAEIQQNSNLTYRMYDYNRKDRNGNLRPLHIDKALAVANLKGQSEPKQPIRLLRYQRGIASELLCQCEYFQVNRYLLNTEETKSLVKVESNPDSFQVFLCIEGCGVIYMEDGDFINFFKGDCVFVPANAAAFKLHGKAKYIGVHC